MSVHTASNWDDTGTCPFCGGALSDPGAGFIDHIHDHPDCEESFDLWRGNLADDLAGEWSG